MNELNIDCCFALVSNRNSLDKQWSKLLKIGLSQSWVCRLIVGSVFFSFKQTEVPPCPCKDSQPVHLLTSDTTTPMILNEKHTSGHGFQLFEDSCWHGTSGSLLSVVCYFSLHGDKPHPWCKGNHWRCCLTTKSKVQAVSIRKSGDSHKLFNRWNKRKRWIILFLSIFNFVLLFFLFLSLHLSVHADLLTFTLIITHHW